MAYQEISDAFWNPVEPLLDPFKRKKSGGSPPVEFRCILNGIFSRLKTGCQWGHLPPCYGSKSTVHEHFQRWVQAGVFAEIFRVYAEEYQEAHGIEWTWQAMDGALMQAPVRGQAVCLADEALGRNPTDRGRSGSKMPLHVDQNGIPLGVTLVGAHVHDSRLVSSTLAAAILPRPEPTPDQPQHLCLDKGYDYARVEREVWPIMPTSRTFAASARKKSPQGPKPNRPGAGWSSGPSPGSKGFGRFGPATLARPRTIWPLFTWPVR
ncbi:MAG: IS5 family transposase [Candidatus Competibacteraceae bacterium]|nr:IS5 family transposase [Candidatus Competibacteraceae bacterium]